MSFVRSPNSSNSNNVRNVNTDGSSNNNNAYNGNNGVRPALVEHRDQVPRCGGAESRGPPIKGMNIPSKGTTPRTNT